MLGKSIDKRDSPNSSGMNQAIAVLRPNTENINPHTFHPNFMLKNDFKKILIEPLPCRVRKEKKAPTAGPNAAKIETGIVIAVNNSLVIGMILNPANINGNHIDHDHIKVTIKNLSGNFSFMLSPNYTIFFSINMTYNMTYVFKYKFVAFQAFHAT